ncbi:hypothetical protein Aperf_G00000096217 [Anoplocephala perfoliata]
MKFAEHLSAHLTPEWRKQYIEYEALKEILYKALDDFEELPVVDAVTVSKHFDQCDAIFFAMCQAELDKINNFFAEKLAEAKRKFAALRDEYDRHFSVHRWAPIPSFYMNSPATVISEDHCQDVSLYRTAESTPNYTHGTVGQINDMDMLRRRRNTLRLKKGEKRFANTTQQVGQNEETPRLKTYDLKLALSEFYLSLVLLQNYQSLNYTGFRKILKKHDKLFQRSNGLEWYRDVISGEPFHTDDSVDLMITEVEDSFTKLEGGDRQKAMKRLRVPPLAAQASGKSIFRFGLFLGIFLAELVSIVLVGVFTKVPRFSFPAFRLFRGSFLVIYYICMIGVNVYGWRSSGVNHVLIFEIDPRSHLNQFQLMEVGMFFAVFWGAAVLLYQFSDLIRLPGYAAPFTLFLLLLMFLFLPFQVFHYKSRFWLLKILCRIIRAPLARVRFPDFFLADQLNSLSFILPDLAYFLCFFIHFIDGQMMIKSNLRNATAVGTGQSPLFTPKAGFCDGMMWGLQPILKALPAWWRFLQCLRRYRDLAIKSPMPHLMNAGKYSTTLIAIAFTSLSGLIQNKILFAFMVIARVLNSVCTTTWDLVMDWGLLDRHSKENFMLREELVYRFRAYYYGAIIEDVIIRFAWILPLAFRNAPYIVDTEIVTSAVMFAEVTRRIIWNFFRLENEHLNNCGNFRAVRDIGITPIRRPTPDPAEVVGQEGDKAYGMFNQLLTFTRNTANSCNHNHDDNGSNNGNSRLSAMEGDHGELTATFAEYATALKHNNRKSLWNHLRETYLHQKKEKQRKVEMDLIFNMEEALRTARREVQAKASTMPPRGASPTRDPSRAQAKLYAKAQQVSPTSPPIAITNSGAVSNRSPRVSELRHRFRSNSDFALMRRSDRDTHSRQVMVDGHQRKAFAKATIPLTVCFLEPQQANSAESRFSGCRTPAFASTTDLPVFPNQASGILLPCTGENTNVNGGLDLVLAPEKLSHLNGDDSPDDTVLPIRTRALANQLRDLLNAFNSGQSAATPSIAGVTRPALPAAPATSQAPNPSNRPRRWRLESAGALLGGRGHRLIRTQTAQQRWRIDGAGKMSDANIEAIGKAKSKTRCKSVGTMEGINSDDRGRHTSVETSSVSLGEDLDDLEKCERDDESTHSSPRRPTYPSKFTVETVKNAEDGVTRF